MKVGVAHFFVIGSFEVSPDGQSRVEKLRELVEPMVLCEGLDLWDIEFRREANGMVLRIFIDKQGGSNVQDLSRVSRQVGDLLDVKGDRKSVV